MLSVRISKARGSPPSKKRKDHWSLEVYIEDEQDRLDTAKALESMHLKKAWGLTIVDTAPTCAQTTSHYPVIFFNDYQFYGNYYHFTYDALLPLFRQLTLRGLVSNAAKLSDRVRIFPAQQKAWHELQDWSTTEFSDSKRFHMDIMTSLFPGTMVPVDARAASTVHGACFSNASFGTPFAWDDGTIDQSPAPFSPTSGGSRDVPSNRRELLRTFTEFVRGQLGLPTSNSARKYYSDDVVRIGLISRRQRRKIVNERAIVDGLSRLELSGQPNLRVVGELVDFNGMSYRDQVVKAGEMDVLVGMNGAGLINAWYTGADAVVVQMLPHGSNLNFDEFRSILRAVTPPIENRADGTGEEIYSSHDHYMEWKNTFAENAFQPRNQYQPFDNEDTKLDEGEFYALMRRAVAQVIATRSFRQQQGKSHHSGKEGEVEVVLVTTDNADNSDEAHFRRSF